ncbi:hypothetical protein MIND_01257400 [Mycena indigotica]|uniref:HNH domain-containing protein n=1 Tax=Mycena indigotica TaxID=2126181 RepID=A0A8H6S2B2_9AGAR|nr:uncharacterized protein MIND_01257400 [Mycena indigotica]KAF7291142.1 hypothetical protein MIND_01257400 [Mycena indigotica]
MSPSASQFLILKDCIARRLLLVPELHDPDSGSDLDEFTSYLAEDLWGTMPVSLQTASYETKEVLDGSKLSSLPPSFEETLVTYGIVAAEADSYPFLEKVLADYLSTACAPPPIWSSTRTDECEICERRVPLTYHHLIPRSVHQKALRRKWHPPSRLNAVAWLCRPCHTAVHQVAPNEVLAQHYHTIELLLAREDIRRWGQYASKQRWGVRRG